MWTGNHVYLHLSVAFIQIFKAFTPVITMSCLFLAGLEEPTHEMIAAVFIIAFGTAMTAYGELGLSLLGLFLNLTSGISESIRLVMTQVRSNVLRCCYALHLACVHSLCPPEPLLQHQTIPRISHHA